MKEWSKLRVYSLFDNCSRWYCFQFDFLDLWSARYLTTNLLRSLRISATMLSLTFVKRLSGRSTVLEESRLRIDSRLKGHLIEDISSGILVRSLGLGFEQIVWELVVWEPYHSARTSFYSIKIILPLRWALFMLIAPLKYRMIIFWSGTSTTPRT